METEGGGLVQNWSPPPVPDTTSGLNPAYAGPPGPPAASMTPESPTFLLQGRIPN